jgi:NADH dehydrogenase
MQRIVIVGGGAGGLELATQLGRKLGKKNKAEILLIDANPTHLWKPLLHEVATGALDSGIDELNYRAHGKKHGFQFQIGRMSGLNRKDKSVVLSAMLDDSGEEVLPQRTVSYDTLVIALGSVTNDFGTAGAADHCIFLDSRLQAERFHKLLLNEFLRCSNADEPRPLEVAIVGAGATGVELSAELYNTAEIMAAYGLKNVSPEQLKVRLIEAGTRILPALPPRLSAAAKRELEALGVEVLTDTKVTQVTDKGFINDAGETITAAIRVWAAGVKAPEFMATLGLETNRANQLVVNASLQTEDESIFALGDCCSVIDKATGKPVPPRAQAAHQQSSHLVNALSARHKGKEMPEFVYKDKGSLVSLSRYSTVGSLMGNLTKGSMMIEGRLARLVYVSLYRLHQVALHGYWHTLLLSVVGHINKVIRPRLKLH